MYNVHQFAVFQLIISLALASPIKIRAVDCLDSAAPYDQSCWATLDLSNWITTWRTATPPCTYADDGAHCCNPSSAPNEPWTACFLRLALADADYDCDVLNSDSCSLAGFTLAPSLSLDSTSSAQYRYTVRNIYGRTIGFSRLSRYAKSPEAINNLFNTWYTSLDYASAQAALSIPPNINEVDPNRQTRFELADILKALGGGLAFLALPELAAGLSTFFASTAIANILSTALQQAPNVAKGTAPFLSKFIRSTH